MALALDSIGSPRAFADFRSGVQGSNLAWWEAVTFYLWLNQFSAKAYLLMAFINLIFQEKPQGPGC